MRYRRDAALDKIAMFFLEQGRVIESFREYAKTPGAPLRMKEVLKFFNSWDRVVRLVRSNYPNIIEEIEGSKKDKETPIDSIVMPDIQAQLAVAKAMAAMELEDGKDF